MSASQPLPPLYRLVATAIAGLPPGLAGAPYAQALERLLEPAWIADYRRATGPAEIVQVGDANRYLFDTRAQRLVAAWCLSRGRANHVRCKSRMAGFPLGEGGDYHRGHAIAHTLGGELDINLVAQLGRLNVGAFRVLEREAVGSPGAFYFTYWLYRRAKPAPGGRAGQTPTAVHQGLLRPGAPPDIRVFDN